MAFSYRNLISFLKSLLDSRFYSHPDPTHSSLPSSASASDQSLVIKNVANWFHKGLKYRVCLRIPVGRRHSI